MSTYIGIDVSKAKLDVAWIRDPATNKVKTRVFGNRKKDYPALLDWLLKQTGQPVEQLHILMEATGIYHESLAYFLYGSGVRVSVINPARIHSYAKSLNTQHKTDKSDSVVIARFGASHAPHTLWQPEPAEIRKLKALLNRIQALETDLQRERNRLEKLDSSADQQDAVYQSLRHMIQVLEKEKSQLEKDVDDHIDRHPQLKKDQALLQSIPGIGPVLSRLMLSVIKSRDFTSAPQCAAFLGLIPHLRESGTFKGQTRLSKRGNPLIKTKLYMAAVVASQHNPTIKMQRQRLLQNGKNKMQALGAAMRKLVHLCYGVLKTQTPYNAEAAMPGS